MKGIYRAYQDGILIAEQHNLITTLGKRAIQRFYCGITGNFAQSFVLGVGATAAAIGDTSLEYEALRIPVSSITPDYANTNIIYKGRIGAGIAGSYYEMGLHSSGVNTAMAYGATTVTTFDSSTEPWVGGTWASSATRIGVDGLQLAPAANATAVATLSDLVLDLSRYSNTDKFKWAYNNTAANAASVRLRFYTDASNYYTYTVATPTTAYRVEQFTKANFVATGTPSWATIRSIDVAVTAGAGGAASVHMDGVRIEPVLISEEDGVLVSRSIYSATPVLKTQGVPIDLEYTLDLTL